MLIQRIARMREVRETASGRRDNKLLLVTMSTRMFLRVLNEPNHKGTKTQRLLIDFVS